MAGIFYNAIKIIIFIHHGWSPTILRAEDFMLVFNRTCQWYVWNIFPYILLKLYCNYEGQITKHWTPIENNVQKNTLILYNNSQKVITLTLLPHNSGKWYLNWQGYSRLICWVIHLFCLFCLVLLSSLCDRDWFVMSKI